jgi:branched-chain amino acid transport system ATP-binding protein
VIVDELAALCLRLGREGISILLIEQIFGLVHRVAERYYVLAKGAVVEEGRLEGLTIDSFEEACCRLTGLPVSTH